MSLPFNQKNPDAALVSLKVSNNILLSQMNDLMDLIVVAEHDDTSKKNHEEIIKSSSEVKLEDDLKEEK